MGVKIVNRMSDRVLKERTRTIKDLREGESVWCVPWAFDRGIPMDYPLDLLGTGRPMDGPFGTATLKVTKENGDYVLDLTYVDARYQKEVIGGCR